MARRAFFQFEDNGPEKANFKFDKCDKVKAVFKIDPPTVNYELLINKPKINHIELVGDKSLEDLGIITTITNLIHEHNISEDAHEYIRNLIYQETADREAADVIINGRIDDEIRDREIADNTLHGEITAESIQREIQDNLLSGRIDSEATARENADTVINNKIEDIEDLIPAEASSSNQLADKEFVNLSIATNTSNVACWSDDVRKFSFTSISGYSASANQMLTHDTSGNLKWVDI